MSTRRRKPFQFQKGDEVRCIVKYEDDSSDGGIVRHFTRNRVYLVEEAFPLDSNLGDWLQFKEDNQGVPNGWNARYFKLEKRNNKLVKGRIK